MIIGYNHNIRYQSRIFHVQTEDSGLSNPRIITHLFVGGNILATSRSSYEDLLELSLNEASLEVEIKARMKAQHVKMIKALQAGEHVERAKLYPDAKHAETSTVVNAVDTINPKGRESQPLPFLDESPTNPSMPASPGDFQKPARSSFRPQASSKMEVNTAGRSASPYRSTLSLRPSFGRPREEEETKSESVEVGPQAQEETSSSPKNFRETAPVNLFRRSRTATLQRPSFQAPPSETSSGEHEQQLKEENTEASSESNEDSSRKTGPLRPVLDLKNAPRSFRPPTKNNS
jgi:hypothetical protein